MHILLASLLTISILLVSCTRPKNQAFLAAEGDGPLFRRGAVAAYVQAHNDEIAASLQECFDRRAADGMQILALSGGGQWGAYGVGFLKAWRASGRPDQFDIVTGVSTGSLQATFAFLGTPADDDLLWEAYDIKSGADVYNIRFPLTPWSSSLATNSPLRSRLEHFVTPEIIDRVAYEGEHNKRRLFVGSVNTDLGQFWVWDLTRIAAGSDRAAARTAYIDCLMASAALPGFFPPQYIDGFQHVDGGTKRNVFVELLREQVQVQKEKGARPPAPIDVYLLLNGKVESRGRFVPDNFLSIGLRSLNLLMDERMAGNVYRAFTESDPTNDNMHFHVHSIPYSACDSDNETDISLAEREHGFNPQVMHCLYDRGLEAFDGGDPWFENVAAWENRYRTPVTSKSARTKEGSADLPKQHEPQRPAR